ncbi:tungstate ABC transporter substrate-binding protein WtpA [Desulfosediminicola flagellatus]|uniref:tungstate ABC transporter substrate-binding protein WtpA n=1 Tax=Desulfosediminicola flagellatus TaxID=2569541 RepID=UPI0010ABAE8D|nr:tungstate ABC transporter substrate-binding protein WtpA [Desulfosediminicola flagellatus]
MRNTRKSSWLIRFGCALLLTLFAAMAHAGPQGDLTIYHAGSLTVPLKQMIKEFNQIYPEVNVITKAGGSTKMARLISEKGEMADIMASADYMVIDNNLIPAFADWNIRFASNRLVLCYTDKSKNSDTLTKDNWYDILRTPEVQWGHSDPNLDPCGYRSLMVMQLAERYYGIDGLYDQLLANRPLKNVKAKAIQLVEMLQSGDLDYGWEYLSVAVQHKLNYLELSDEVNLGNYAYDTLYSTAKVTVTGKKPGTFIDKKGKSITYGVTMLKHAPNKEAAEAFLQFMLSGDNGLKVLDEMGQPAFNPARVPTEMMQRQLPEKLAKLVEVKS